MVKPPSGSNALSNNGQSAHTSMQPPEESGDFSFIVLERSQEQLHSGFDSSTHQMQPQSRTQSIGIQDTIVGPSSHEEVQRKLRDVLQENNKLKDTLEQNNLAMKQQMNTLVAWQEDVAKVHETHREKFEETRALISKLRAENLTLKKKFEQQQPNIEKLQLENCELKSKIVTVEASLAEKQDLLKDSSALMAKVVHIEDQLLKSQQALEYAEQKVIELNGKQRDLMNENEEMKQRISLLQMELELSQRENFVVINENNTSLQQEPNASMVTEPKKIDDGIKRPFPEAMENYEEKLLESLQCLVQHCECFSQLNAWLVEVAQRLPHASAKLDMSTLKTLLDRVLQHLRSSETRCVDYRTRFEEARYQLGRLASDFQELQLQWLQLQKEKMEIKQNDTSYLDVQAKGFKQQIDQLTAELIEIRERYTEAEKKLAKQTEELAEKETISTELNETVLNLNTILMKKDAELAGFKNNMVTLQQNVDALTAQAEVYKMDFEEERESRGKLAAEKDKVADDLRALQKHNQELLEELEECRKQLADTSQKSNNSGGRSRDSYNTIAAPGRNRNQQHSRDTVEQRRTNTPPMYPYECPICQLGFKTLSPLDAHVEICLSKDSMYP